MKTSTVLVAGIGLTLAGTTTIVAQKAKGEVRLAVTIADRTDGNYRIESDGAGPYQDGLSGVSAVLDQYGNLIVNFDQPRRGSGRLVAFDYSCPVNEDGLPECGSTAADPPSGLHPRAFISTVCKTGATCSRIQEMAAGSSQCMQLNFQFTDALGRSWRNGFHRDRDLPSQDGTAYALIARDLNQPLWTVEPKAVCGSGNDGFARTFQVETVKSQWVYTDYGVFSLPFKLTLVPLN